MLAKYRLETENTVFNLARTKFILLITEQALTCKISKLKVCLPSLAYVTNEHKLCVVELFKGNMNAIRERCNIEIATEKILRQAVYLFDGICAIGVNTDTELTKVCNTQQKGTIRVLLLTYPWDAPPLAITNLSNRREV